jgi:hypothetical protein
MRYAVSFLEYMWYAIMSFVFFFNTSYTLQLNGCDVQNLLIQCTVPTV